MNRAQFDTIARQILATLTPRRRHQFHRPTHPYYQENATRICLQQDNTTAQKRAREEEKEATTKRLRKNDRKLLWDLCTVMEARGHDDEEIEHLLAHNPDRSLSFDTTWLWMRMGIHGYLASLVSTLFAGVIEREITTVYAAKCLGKWCVSAGGVSRQPVCLAKWCGVVKWGCDDQ